MLQGPGIPGEIIPVMGMVTGMVSMVLIAVTVVKVAQSQIGQAIARRLQGRGGAAEEEMRNLMLDLREQVTDLEHRLAESDERLDFTERKLAQRGEPARIQGKAADASG
jgi:hypothetical protein